MGEDGETAGLASAWVSLGYVARAHGVRGGLRLHLWNPDGDTLAEGLEVELRAEGRAPLRTHVGKIYGAGLVMLDAVPDRNAAEACRGAEIFVRREDFPEPDEEEGYLVDLVGALVVEVDGRVRGTIVGFTDNVAQPLAEVQVEGRDETVLVPFVPEIVVRIEEGEPRRVVVDAPLGLFDPDQAL